MTRQRGKGTHLSVFSGREADLNRVILKILERKGALIAYDVWLQVRAIKGFRHTMYKTVCRRMQALERQRWVAQKGTRPTQPGWESTLYELQLRGKAALKIDEKSIDNFLLTAKNERLQLLVAALE